MRYVLDFGSANAGSSPTFSVFENADTLANLTPPTISPSEAGLFYFDWSWTTTTATSINYKASVNGIELSDTIRSDEVPTASGTGTAGAALVTWQRTAGGIINTVAVEVGLSQANDPYTSTDPNFIQLRTLFRAAGMEIARAREWKALVKECTITGDGTSTVFNLPADFLRMVDDSGWNRTSVLPLLGPSSSQEWQSLKAWGSTISTTVLYRIIQHRMHFFSAPTNANSIRFDYVSRYWITTSGAETPDALEPTVSADTPVFDAYLMERALKVKWLVAKGFDATGALDEYASAFEAAAAAEPAPTLNMAGGRREFRLLDRYNVRDTGYGS